MNWQSDGSPKKPQTPTTDIYDKPDSKRRKPGNVPDIYGGGSEAQQLYDNGEAGEQIYDNDEAGGEQIYDNGEAADIYDPAPEPTYTYSEKVIVL